MRVDKALSLLALTLLLGTPLARAAETHQHDHAAGASPPSRNCDLPSLACASAPGSVFDTAGRLWVAWAFGGHLYVNHSDDLGQSFSAPVVVNRVPEPISAKGENRPKIALDKAGRIFLSWTTPLAQRFTGNIRFSHSLDGGKHFSDPVTVNDNHDLTSHRFEALGVNDRGDIYLAWLDKRDRVKVEQAGGQYRGAALYYTLSRDHGASFEPNVKVADNSCECCRVAMAIDERGLPAVMWRHIYGDNIRDHALVRFAAPGKAAEPKRVSHDNWQIEACPHHGPALSIANDGVVHMGWFNNAPERHGLFYAHVATEGGKPSDPHPVGTYDKAASHPSVLSLGKEVYLAWGEFDGAHNAILLQHSSDGGATWDTPRRIAETIGEADYPFLLSRSGQAYLAWQTVREGYRLIAVARRR